MNRALLRLFNAVLVEDDVGQDISAAVLERTTRNGYVLDPRIRPEDDLLNTIEDIVGISGEKANAAFHKSWSIIRDASMEELVMQQVLHYLTTYGFEELGIYRESAVYIPREVLECPDITEDMPLTVVRALNKNEILEKIIGLGSGIALAQQTLDDVMSIVVTCKYDPAFAEKIANRELKALLFDYYELVPSDPVEFLRHLVSKLTDDSLLIKNKALIEKLENANGKFLDVLLKDAPKDLASIFLRYKPLFLAMKKISRNKTFFNRLRKQAVKLHKPLQQDYLNSITSQIKNETLDLDEFARKLERASIFRKIRLAYALNFRLHHTGSIVYRVRNGRGWATEFSWSNDWNEKLSQALSILLESTAADIGRNVKGKTIYIPSNVHYALPATEKQFTGHLPTGSYISVPEDLIAGIHWFNTKRRIDLDLSLIGQSGKIGWDAAYRTGDRSVLFSGDVTDAPRPDGATELFYLKKHTDEPRILNVNYYNFQKDDEVDCKIIAAHESPSTKFGENYMVDVSKIIAQANIKVSRKQSVLGLITSVDGENRVYFANISIGNSITARANPVSTAARNYLVAHTSNPLSLRTVLKMAGAEVVDEPVEGDHIDLSPSSLDKSTIVNLIRDRSDGGESI